jgi:hypothetical protein
MLEIVIAAIGGLVVGWSLRTLFDLWRYRNWHECEREEAFEEIIKEARRKQAAGIPLFGPEKLAADMPDQVPVMNRIEPSSFWRSPHRIVPPLDQEERKRGQPGYRGS